MNGHYIEVIQIGNRQFRRTTEIEGVGVNIISDLIPDGRELRRFDLCGTPFQQSKAFGIWATKPVRVDFLDNNAAILDSKEIAGRGAFWFPDTFPELSRVAGLAVQLQDIGQDRPVAVRFIVDAMVPQKAAAELEKQPEGAGPDVEIDPEDNAAET